MLRTVAHGCLPFDKFAHLKRLYSSPTLIKEADELETFHSIRRHKGESIVDFILRIDKQSHYLATQRNYIVNDKIKIAKVRKSVRGNLISIAVSAIERPGATWEKVRQCVIDNKDFDLSEHEQNFAGNVRFSQFQRRSNSRSPFRGRSHSKSPSRVPQAESSTRSSFSRVSRENSSRSRDQRSHYSKSKSPRRPSSSNDRFQSRDHRSGRSPARSSRRSYFGRSDSRHASSRDRGRSSSADQKRPKKNFASKSDKFPNRHFKHRNFRKFNRKSHSNYANLVTYSRDDNGEYHPDPNGEWISDDEMSDSVNRDAELSEHACVSSANYNKHNTEEDSYSEDEHSQTSGANSEVDQDNVIGSVNSAQVRFDTLPIRGEQYCGMAYVPPSNQRCASGCRCESHSNASVHQNEGSIGNYFASTLLLASNRKASGARSPSPRSLSPRDQLDVDNSSGDTRVVGSANIAMESNTPPTPPDVRQLLDSIFGPVSPTSNTPVLSSQSIMPSHSPTPPVAEMVDNTETVVLADSYVTPHAFPLTLGVRLSENAWHEYKQSLGEPGPCVVYPFYERTIAINIVSGEFIWGQRHSEVVIRHTPDDTTHYSNPDLQLIEAEYCRDTLHLVEECNCEYCRRLTKRDPQKDGEVLIRVFRLNEHNTFLSRDRESLFGENVLYDAYDRITPNRNDIYNEAECSVSSISYATAIRAIGRIIALQERARQGGTPDDLIGDPQEGLPFVTVYEVHDQCKRYRVHRPHMIAKPMIDNCRMDTIVWEDYDFKLREDFASHPSEHTSIARQDIKKIFIEAFRCMVTRTRVDRCLCNMCKEMRGMPTEPSIPGYQLVNVSSNLSEFTRDILSDNFDEDRRAPDGDNNGDSSPDDSNDSDGDDDQGSDGPEGRQPREQPQDEDTSPEQLEYLHQAEDFVSIRTSSVSSDSWSRSSNSPIPMDETPRAELSDESTPEVIPTPPSNSPPDVTHSSPDDTWMSMSNCPMFSPSSIIQSTSSSNEPFASLTSDIPTVVDSSPTQPAYDTPPPSPTHSITIPPFSPTTPAYATPPASPDIARTAPTHAMSVSQESSSTESSLSLTSVISTVSIFPPAVNFMIPPGVVPPENHGEVHTPDVINAYSFNWLACGDDDITGTLFWELTFRESVMPGPFTTVRNRVSHRTYKAIRVDIPTVNNVNAQWFICPYRHNLIFIAGTHCAYTGTVLPFCPCELCAGFRPWLFRPSSVWNGIRYVLVYNSSSVVSIPSTPEPRRPRTRHADDDNDESDSVQAARAARRQRRRHNTLVCTPPRSQNAQGNVVYHACVGVDGTVGSDDDDDLPALLAPVQPRVPEDIDLSRELPSEPVIVLDDLDYPGTLLYDTPLPGPHVVVVNVVTGQPYRVQRVSFRHRDQMTSVWYRDVYRHNITYISGTLCQQTMNSIETCTCGVCGCIGMILAQRRSCMRPLSPTRNRETYVYVREHIPTHTHTPADSSPLTYIDDIAVPRNTTNDNARTAAAVDANDDDISIPDAEPLHAEHESNSLDPSRVNSVLLRYSRNADGTYVSTPVSLMRGPASATLSGEMRRPLSFLRTQNVTPVRSPRPMINGDDSAHDHNALNTHNVNDNDNDHDESGDDDMFAYERDPNDHRKWRRTRVAVVENNNVHHRSRHFRNAAYSNTHHPLTPSPNTPAVDSVYSESTPVYTRTHIHDSDDDIDDDDDNDEEEPPPLYDSVRDSDDGDDDHSDIDDSDVADNSDDNGRPFRRVTYTRTCTNTPVSRRTGSTSVRRDVFALDEATHQEMLALMTDVLTRIPTSRDSLSSSPPPLTPSDSDSTTSVEYVAVNTVINLRNIVRDPVVRDPVSGVFHALSVNDHRMIISDSGATKSMFSDSSVFRNYRRVKGISVRMAGGALEQVIGMGDVGPLKDVLHVPNLVFDLVSEPMLARQGMQGAWADDWKTIRTREGRLFLVAHLNAHNLYEVNPMYLGLRNPAYNYECYEANASKVEAVDLLHRTWGHISLDRLQAGINSRHINWSHPSLPVNFRKIGSQCVVCALGKSKRRMFSRPLRHVSVPGSHFYMDVWGPAECPSLLYHNVYMIGFIDAATKFL